MISCERCEELINARLDGYLTEEEALLLEAHLTSCPDCQKLDRDLTTLHERLKELSFDPPQDFTASVMTQLEVPSVQPAKKRKRPWSVIACAAAAVVLMVVALTPQMSPFGGSDAESAGAAEAPTSADIAADAAPEESRAESETQESKVEAMTEKEAYDLLVAYLIDLGVSLDLSPGLLSEDGSFWTFTGYDMDSDSLSRFNISCADGFVEEIPLP